MDIAIHIYWWETILRLTCSFIGKKTFDCDAGSNFQLVVVGDGEVLSAMSPDFLRRCSWFSSWILRKPYQRWYVHGGTNYGKPPNFPSEIYRKVYIKNLRYTLWSLYNLIYLWYVATVVVLKSLAVHETIQQLLVMDTLQSFNMAINNYTFIFPWKVGNVHCHVEVPGVSSATELLEVN